MNEAFIVTGTDTGVGKTVFSAALVGALCGNYWKPIQSGLETETDSSCVLRLARLPASHIVQEAYRLKLPASPHIAAAHEGVMIEAGRLSLPKSVRPMVIEGAGGLLVPLSNDLLQIDLFAAWKLPVILCARTALGTINHTLLSLEAMARRRMRLLGIVFIGDAEPEVEATIISIGGVSRLGRLPFLDPLDSSTLAEAFAANFSVRDFLVPVECNGDTPVRNHGN